MGHSGRGHASSDGGVHAVTATALRRVSSSGASRSPGGRGSLGSFVADCCCVGRVLGEREDNGEGDFDDFCGVVVGRSGVGGTQIGAGPSDRHGRDRPCRRRFCQEAPTGCCSAAVRLGDRGLSSGLARCVCPGQRLFVEPSCLARPPGDSQDHPRRVVSGTYCLPVGERRTDRSSDHEKRSTCSGPGGCVANGNREVGGA